MIGFYCVWYVVISSCEGHACCWLVVVVVADGCGFVAEFGMGTFVN